jgi:hypothetical protein
LPKEVPETSEINVPEASHPVCSASLLSNNVEVENKSQSAETKPRIRSLNNDYYAFRVHLLGPVKENNNSISNYTMQSASSSTRSIGQLTPIDP